MFFLKLTLATLRTETDVMLDPTQPYRQSFFFGVMMPRGLRATFREPIC